MHLLWTELFTANMPKFVYNNNFDYLEKGVEYGQKNSFLHIIG